MAKDQDTAILDELKKHTKLLLELNEGITELVNAMYDDEDEEGSDDEDEEVEAVEPKELDLSKLKI